METMLGMAYVFNSLPTGFVLKGLLLVFCIMLLLLRIEQTLRPQRGSVRCDDVIFST